MADSGHHHLPLWRPTMTRSGGPMRPGPYDRPTPPQMFPQQLFPRPTRLPSWALPPSASGQLHRQFPGIEAGWTPSPIPTFPPTPPAAWTSDTGSTDPAWYLVHPTPSVPHRPHAHDPPTASCSRPWITTTTRPAQQHHEIPPTPHAPFQH